MVFDGMVCRIVFVGGCLVVKAMILTRETGRSLYPSSPLGSLCYPRLRKYPSPDFQVWIPRTKAATLVANSKPVRESPSRGLCRIGSFI